MPPKGAAVSGRLDKVTMVAVGHETMIWALDWWSSVIICCKCPVGSIAIYSKLPLGKPLCPDFGPSLDHTRGPRPLILE